MNASEIIPAIEGLIDQVRGGATFGYSAGIVVIIGLGVWIALRRSYFGLRASSLDYLNHRARRGF